MFDWGLAKNIFTAKIAVGPDAIIPDKAIK
jgi:hypothetical protein